MSSVTNSLRRAAPRIVGRRPAERDLYDSFFSGSALDHFDRFTYRPFFPNIGQTFNKFDNDDFFQSIDRAGVEPEETEDTDMADANDANAPRGYAKSWSYSSVTRNGQTTSEEKKHYQTSNGQTFARHERTLPDGRSMVSDNRDSAILIDQPDDQSILDDEAVESFERDFQESYFGRSTEKTENLADREPHEEAAPTLRDTEEQPQESSEQAGRRLNYLADLHEQGLLSDAEFVAAKRANQTSL